MLTHREHFGKPKTTAISLAAISAVLLISLFGCATEVVEEEGLAAQESFADEKTQLEVEQILRAQGFDTSDLVFSDDGTVVVEGDIRMKVSDIIETSLAEVAKGYWYSSKGKADGSRMINIWYMGDFSSSWTAAMYNAGLDWKNNTDLEFGWTGSTPPPAGSQSIAFIPQTLGNCTYAQGTWPSNGLAGTIIKINSGFNCNGQTIESLSSAQKKKIATHEIGHNVGLTHPGTQTHILDTGLASSGYNSVMWQGAVGGKITSNLSSDDKKSVNILY